MRSEIDQERRIGKNLKDGVSIPSY